VILATANLHESNKDGERDENDFGHRPLPEVKLQRDRFHVLEQENHKRETPTTKPAITLGFFTIPPPCGVKDCP